MQPAQPQVQSLSDIIASLNPIYDSQRQAINQQISNNQQSGGAQMSALDAAKQAAFQSINQNASNRGLLFSGFSPNEQAQYLGTRYLPAVAQLQQGIQDRNNTLTNQLLGIDTNVQKQALDTQQGQVKDQNAYALQQQQLAQQLAITQANNDTKLKAAGISAGNSKQSSQAQQQAAMQQGANQLDTYLQQYRGKDGYVSPGGYNSARSAWAQDGFDVKTFDAIFGKYKNPNQPKGQYQ